MYKRLVAILIIGSFLLSINLFAYDYSKIPGSETYKRANSVLALVEKTYVLNDDGSYTADIHLIRKILNQKGKRRFAEYKITYARDFKEVDIIRAQTVNEDGSIDVVKEEEINDMDHPVATKAPRYPEVGILVVSFPSVDIGDIVEISYQVKTNADFPFYGGECFQFHDPLLEKEVIIELPENAIFHFNEPEDVSFSQSRENGWIRYEWTTVDKEGIVEEEHQAPLNLLAPTLYYSNIPELEGFLRDLNRRMVERAEVTSEIRKKAEQIISDGSGDYTKVKRLYDFVNGKANSIPLDIKTIGGFMTDATTVLNDGYGNSYDKSILLYGLLRSVGMDPKFVFVVGSGKLKLYEEELRQESFSAITRPLVGIRLDNEEVYLDPMLRDGQYGPLGVNDIDGALCYLVEGDKVSAKLISVADRLRNMEYIQTEMQIVGNGCAYMVQREEYSGVNYAEVKRIHKELSPKKLEEYAQKKVDHISRNAVSISGLETKQLPYKFIEAFSCKVPHYAIVDGDFIYFDLGRAITENLKRFIDVSTKKRYNLYFNPERKNQTVDFQVRLPTGYRIVLAPGDFERDLPGDLGKISYERGEGDGSSLSYRLRIDLDEAILSVEDYHKLYSIRQEVAGEKYGKVLLKKK